MKLKNEINVYNWALLDNMEINLEVEPKTNFYINVLKRLIDFFLALAVVTILFPFFVITAIVIKVTMPGPVFFLQERIGYLGKPFTIYKLRTMLIDEEAVKFLDSTKDEERITGFGKFLRRFKLDETPQILNVLKGDMALVGPRPTNKRAILEYEMDERRLSVRPGLTGLAQTNGNVELDWPERVAYDLQYIDSISFLLDFKIIIKTVMVVLVGEENFKNDPQDLLKKYKV